MAACVFSSFSLGMMGMTGGAALLGQVAAAGHMAPFPLYARSQAPKPFLRQPQSSWHQEQPSSVTHSSQLA